MLVDLPNELTIRTNRVDELAGRIVGMGVVDSLRVDADTVCVSTKQASQLLSELPQWVEPGGLQISEVRSADESLQELFSSLLKIHRGEI